MISHWPPAAVLMLANAALLGAFAGYVWRRRDSSGGISLVVLLLAGLEYSVAYALELASVDPGARQFWGDLKYLGVCLIVPAWLAFSLQYAGRQHWLTPRLFALLAVEPVVVLVLLANDATHDLIRYYPPAPAGGVAPVAATGSLGWLHTAYNYGLLMLATGLLVVTLSRLSRLYRKQSWVLVIALAIPWSANVLFLFGVGPPGRLDLTPAAVLLTCAVLVWGVFRYRLLDLAPVAHGRIFETIGDAVVVLDAYQRVVDLNPAGQRVLGCSLDEALGRPLEQLAPGMPGGDDAEVTLGEADAARDYQVTRSPLRDREGRTSGQLVVLRDITARKQVEEELRRALARLERVDGERRELLSRLVTAQEEERRRIATDIHDDPIQAMATAIIRLQMLRRRCLEPEQLKAIDGLERAVSLTLSRLRHLLFELRPPVLDQLGLGAALRQYLEQARQEGGFGFELDDRLAAELPPEIRVIAYRIAQEALTNVGKHAKASLVTARLSEELGGLRVSIRDDGVGFRPATGVPAPPGHIGVVSMRERAEMAGGWCRLSSAPGDGTTVEFWLPLRQPTAAPAPGPPWS